MPEGFAASLSITALACVQSLLTVEQEKTE